MTLRLALAATALLLPAATGNAVAQTVQAQVTMQVPVNLTQFGPDAAKVRVGCTIRSDAITTSTSFGQGQDGKALYGTALHEATLSQEIPMTGGQLVSTASIVFNFAGLDNPAGKGAAIVCSLNGWSTSQQSWVQFTGGATNPSFKTNGPSLGMIDGSFTW